MQERSLKERYEEIVMRLSNQFADGETLDLDGIIFLIGLQELGQLDRRFKKDDKVNLMHIAICRLLEPFGYYAFSHYDEEKWPHYIVKEKLPALKAGEQTRLMKEAIVQYFDEI
jgi:hypothetical protein